MLRKFPATPILLSVYIMKGHWILSKTFLHLKMIVWVMSFILLIQCITMINVHTLKQSYIPGVNPH